MNMNFPMIHQMDISLTAHGWSTWTVVMTLRAGYMVQVLVHSTQVDGRLHRMRNPLVSGAPVIASRLLLTDSFFVVRHRRWVRLIKRVGPVELKFENNFDELSLDNEYSEIDSNINQSVDTERIDGHNALRASRSLFLVHRKLVICLV